MSRGGLYDVDGENPSTIAVTAMASTTMTGLLFVWARRRYPAAPTSRKIISATALLTDAIADRSTTLATISTRPAVINSPAWRPWRESLPKISGNSPTLVSIPVRLPDAYRVALVARAVASSGDRHDGEPGVSERGARGFRDRGLAVPDDLGGGERAKDPERDEDVGRSGMPRA